MTTAGSERPTLLPLKIAAKRLRIPGGDPSRALRRRIEAQEHAIGRDIIVRRGRRGPGAFVVDMAVLRVEMPELFVTIDAEVADAGRAEATRLLAGISAQFETVSADVLDVVTDALARVVDRVGERLAEVRPE